VLEVVRDAAGLDDAESADESLAKLVGLLEGEDDAELVVQRLGDVIGLTEELSGPEDSYSAVRTFLEVLARRCPLIVVFDDIHWGEATFLDLVDHISDWAHDAPLLLICIARTELLDIRPGWGGGKLNATSVLLEPLSEAESEQLVDNLAATLPLEDSSRRQIVEAAGGNPLFVEEMLALLLEDPRDGNAVEVPPTIHALLAARLDRLADDERAAIEAASVEGKIFHEASLAELMAGAPSIVHGSLLNLVRKGLIRPERPGFSGMRAYRFRHLLIRDAAYESIPKEARAALHERFGRWLEQTAGGRATGYEEIIGYHLEQAYLYRVELGPADSATRQLAREAAERLGAAGYRAFLRGDAAAAVNLISRAVPLLPADDPSRVDLVPNIRVVQGLSGDLSWAERVLTEAVATAAATDDRRLQAHALVQRSFLRLSTQPDVTTHELFAVGGHAISVFEEVRDELGLARAWRLVAQAHYLARQAGPSAEAFAHALEHARRTGDRLELREIVEWLCVALMLGPTPAREVAARCEGLLADVRQDPILEPTVLSVLANAEAMQGHLEKAHELLARWREAVDEVGEPIWLFAINFGFVALADDPAAGERDLRPGYEALVRIGEKSHFSSVAGLLARAVCAQGRYEEADRLSRESEQAARPNDIHSHILWRTTRAQTLAHAGDFGAAEALAREAVAFAAESDFLDSHADALTTLAEVRCLARRPDGAAADLEEAIQLYERKGNVASAARTRTKLEQLSPSV
jgi:tetratricopeptide (TPR) repeat protein